MRDAAEHDAPEGFGARVRKALAWPKRAALAGFGVFAFSLVVFGFIGSEFMPQLDEQDLSIQSIRIPSTSLDQSLEMQLGIEKTVTAFPQVDYIYSKTGTAEVASDPMPPNISDAFVILKPRDEWPDPDLSKPELIEQMEQAISKRIGSDFQFSQPIEMRFNELIAGVRGDIAVKIFGDDLEQLTAAANQLAAIFSGIDGATEVSVEQTEGFPTLDIEFNRAAIAAHGLNEAEYALILKRLGRAPNETELGNSIEGGTSEVMLNVISKRILDLPGA